MVNLKELLSSDIESIQIIANQTWHITYGNILSKPQSDFMLEMMYSESALKDQMTNKNHTFLGAMEDNNIVGFVSFEHHYNNTNFTKIHKIYILPNQQGKGLGNILINEVEKVSKQKNEIGLILNVNRNNKAKDFYVKNGFTIFKSEDIEIGNGYLMEDYVMQKLL